MIVEFLAAARAEFLESVGYYNDQSEGLGLEFAQEVRATIERIVQYPEAWPPVSKRTRRCRTKRFPFGIIYQVRGKTLLNIAVMNLHREPRSWKARISKPTQ
jgi:hypothetical protein